MTDDAKLSRQSGDDAPTNAPRAFYRSTVKEAADLLEAAEVEGLDKEIALLRVHVKELMKASALRAVVAQRLRALERDVAEVRTRVNGLLFVVAGAVVTQLVLRLVG